MNHPDDTIAALSSARGPGERAVVRVSGPKTRDVLSAVFGTFKPTPNQFIEGTLRLSGVHSPLPATLYFFQSPKSYTGQDLGELHTIGSPPLVECLLADLFTAGARAAGRGEFTQRAFLAGKLDLTRAEAVQAVIESHDDRDLKTALGHLAGNLAKPLDSLRNDLLNLLADVEAALDFADEDIEFVSTTDTITRIARGLAELTNLRRQLESRTVSGEPYRIALAGAPNAGKSSLFNALAGDAKAIVSAVAGTTRDYLSATITLGGLPVELIDTAGLAAAQDDIDAQSQSLGRDIAKRADLVLHCVEAGGPRTLEMPGSLLVRTKSDLAKSSDGLAVSVVTVNGLAELRDQLLQRVQAHARSPLAPSATRCRHHVDLAMECLRLAHSHALNEQPAELLALDLRLALDHIGQLVGTIYTNDLLDRIFSRFCIGK